jgi:hypothetical protein
MEQIDSQQVGMLQTSVGMKRRALILQEMEFTTCPKKHKLCNAMHSFEA